MFITNENEDLLKDMNTGDPKESNTPKDDESELMGEEYANQKIFEGYILDLVNNGEISLSEDAVNSFVAQGLFSEDMLLEKNIIKIKLDRQTRTNIMLNRSVLYLAKENKDPNYTKLVKVWRMRKVLMDKLFQRWNAKAYQRARKLVSLGALGVKKEVEKGTIVKSADMPKEKSKGKKPSIK